MCDVFVLAATLRRILTWSPSHAPTPPCPSSSTWWRRNWVVSSCHRILACSWTESIRNLHWGHLGPPCRVWEQVRPWAPAVVECAGLPPSSTVTPCLNSYYSTCPCLPPTGGHLKPGIQLDLLSSSYFSATQSLVIGRVYKISINNLVSYKYTDLYG